MTFLRRKAPLFLTAMLTLAGCGGPTTSNDAAPDSGLDVQSDVTVDIERMDTVDVAGNDATDTPSVDSAPACASMLPTLAISSLGWGEGTSGQWRMVGFDLDARSSTAASTDLCQLSSGAAPTTPYPDGDMGIDNSFGKNLLPQLQALNPNFVSDRNASIARGDFTSLLNLGCSPLTGSGSVAGASLFVARPLGMPPVFDGTDVWPVDRDFLSDPTDSNSSTLRFPSATITGSTFSAGTDGAIVLRMPLSTSGSTVSFTLTMRAARLSMTLSADHAHATGMLGGVLDTEELVSQIREIGVAYGLCGTPLLTQLLTSVRQASDIMSDGTQDPTRTCNGISIGLRFDMAAAQHGAVGPVRPIDPTCP